MYLRGYGIDSRECRFVSVDTESTNCSRNNKLFGLMYSFDGYDGMKHTVEQSLDSCRNITQFHAYLHGLIDEAFENDFIYIIGIHNLSHEFTFMKEFFADLQTDYDMSVLADNSKKPFFIRICKDDIEVMRIIDTYKLFGYSVSKLGDMMGKQKGIEDYDEYRTPNTTLNDNDISYLCRDTEIVFDYMNITLSMYGFDISDIGAKSSQKMNYHGVYSKTGIVRKVCRENPRIGGIAIKTYRMKDGVFKSHGYHRLYENSFMKWLRMVQIDEREANLLESYSKGGCYAGGINLANAGLSGKSIEGVISFDYTSAYPAEMMMKVPRFSNHHTVTEFECMKPFECGIEHGADVDVENALYSNNFIATVRITNIRLNERIENQVGDGTITQSMVGKKSIGVEYKGGTLYRADELIIFAMKCELFTIAQFYDYDYIYLVEGSEYYNLEMIYPHPYMVIRMLYYYRDKTTVKNIHKCTDRTERAIMCDEAVKDGMINEYESLSLKNFENDDMIYMNHKSGLNALYGVNVISPFNDSFRLEDGTLVYDSRGNCNLGDSYRWCGIVCSMYNRLKLALCIRCAVDYSERFINVLSDTDSTKFHGISIDEMYKAIEPTIRQWTKLKNEGLQNALHTIKGLSNGSKGTIPTELFVETGDGYKPFDIESFFDFECIGLGEFDYEETYQMFAQTGHKSYAYIDDGKFNVKCSGFNIRVLNEIGEQIMTDTDDFQLAVALTVGYNLTFDASTKIASASVKQCDNVTIDGIGDTPVGTCIVNVPKIHGDMSQMNVTALGYYERFSNSPLHISDIVVTKHNDRYDFIPRDEYGEISRIGFVNYV